MKIDALRKAAGTVALLLAVAGCDGWTTQPTDVTTTGATLHAQARCLGQSTSNPCTYWFQYWADGSATVLGTPRKVWNTSTNGYLDVAETITGLAPNTIYHAQFCGYGDTNVAQPGSCIGLPGSTLSSPGTRPDRGDYNNTRRFRTASASTVATVDLGRPLSTADTNTRPISRDAGFSAAYSATRALWIFGDTVHENGDPPYMFGTTAAAGPYTRGQVPTALQELPTPADPPEPGRTGVALFLPTPVDLRTPDPTPVDCVLDNNAYPATWTSGLTRIPGTERLLIVAHEICVASGRPTWPTERFKLVDYDPATNRFRTTVTPFVADPLSAGVPAAQNLGSPVFGSDGYLYLFGHDFLRGMVFVARVDDDPTTWGNAANYEWWGKPAGQPVQWTGDHSAAVSVVSGTAVYSAHVADFTGVGSHRLAMIVQTGDGDGRFQIFTATSPNGPWTRGPAGQVPDTCVGGTFRCYAFTGHAELSTPDRFWLSWHSPEDRGGRGHLRMAAVAW